MERRSVDEYIHKSHNLPKLMYLFVLSEKYRCVTIDEYVNQVINETCLEISKRYLINFLEIGCDKDYVYFHIQAVPNYSSTKIVEIVKSITVKGVLRKIQK